jgi:hypothetical protein
MSGPCFTLRKLEASDVEFVINVEPECESVSGHFATGDDDLDRKLEREIIEASDAGSVEAWCCIQVTARWGGFEGWDSLGGCSFLTSGNPVPIAKQVAECIEAHAMKEEALDHLNKVIAERAAAIAPLLRRKR